MRILQVIENLDPANGGPQAVVTRLAAAQAALGHEVHLLCYDEPNAATQIENAVARIPGWNCVKIHANPKPDRFECLTGRIAARLAARLLPEIDVVHFHGIWESHLAAIATAARRIGIPYVVTPHSLLDPWALRQKPLKKKIALALRVRRLLNGAAVLHALNVDEQNRIEPLSLRCPTRVVPNGVFLDEFCHLPTPEAFGLRFPQTAGRPFILFLSRLHHKKGLDILSQAFAILAKRITDIDLVVAGPDEGARSEFEEFIAAHGLSSRVHVLGPIYGTEKYEALSAAACFCLPSRMEGFSIAITEALAAALPVVISRECHFPEVAEAGAGEIVELGAKQVADALERVLARPRSELGAAGRQMVEAKFTWPSIAMHLVEVYRLGGANS